MSKSRKDIVREDIPKPKPNELSLLNLPNNLLLIPKGKTESVSITSFFKENEITQVMGVLSNTCTTLHTLFQPSLTELADKAAAKLLEHVLKGEKQAVIDILNKYKHPALLFLFRKAIAKDYSGRTINASPYQAALGAEDTDMLVMMETYFDKITDGRKQALKQYKEQFPNGVKNARCDFNFRPLITVIKNDIFANHQPNETTKKELQKFQDYFTPKATDVIKTGKHFNMNALIKAFEIYNQNYGSGSWWSEDQSSLFWRQVIGYLQRLVPACYAQAFCQGLYNVVEEKKPLVRDFKLDNGAVYYPLDRDHTSLLGKDFGVYSFGCGRRERECGQGGCSNALKKLCPAKAAELRKFKTRLILDHRSQGCQIVRYV
ncbi:MAG: hypothetical protein ACD_46C00539G0008 [uncultured bacterium]|nr:MAG: hypothetical protein ACD_46C00539G0008 [uncultured bacterium]